MLKSQYLLTRHTLHIYVSTLQQKVTHIKAVAIDER